LNAGAFEREEAVLKRSQINDIAMIYGEEKKERH
jgi:hypothetical protein